MVNRCIQVTDFCLNCYCTAKQISLFPSDRNAKSSQARIGGFDVLDMQPLFFGPFLIERHCYVGDCQTSSFVKG